MTPKRLTSIIITLIVAITGFGLFSDDAYAAGPAPEYCNSYQEIGAALDRNLLLHKKSFSIAVQEKDIPFLDHHILSTHRKIDPYSILRAGEDLSFTRTLNAVSKEGNRHFIFTLKPKYKHKAKNDKKFYSKVKSVANKAKKIKSKKKRVKYINNYLTRNTRYSTRYTTAYDAIVRGKGNCSAYSEAFTIIACHAGLQAETVTGVFKRGRTRMPHAWNVVKLGSNWYGVDVTNNDQRSRSTSNRFLLPSNKKFKKNHKLDTYYSRIGWTKSHPMK